VVIPRLAVASPDGVEKKHQADSDDKFIVNEEGW
jgi:hypothetical protein